MYNRKSQDKVWDSAVSHDPANPLFPLAKRVVFMRNFVYVLIDISLRDELQVMMYESRSMS